jgi:transcriptional regulator with XRE-family HTH domain
VACFFIGEDIRQNSAFFELFKLTPTFFIGIINPLKEVFFMNFDGILRCYRHMFCLTQNEVADALHVDRSTYAYYENGKSIPPVEFMRRFAALFSIPLSLIFGDEKHQKLPSHPENTVSRPVTQLLFADVDNPIAELYSHTIHTAKPSDKKAETFGELPPDEKELLIRYRIMKATERSKDKTAEEISSAQIIEFLNRFHGE